MAKQTPMMEQYSRIKRENHDAILLFRLGDFYEMFEKDAVYAASVLNITLTQRNGIPMCGFPHHAAHNYISRLLVEGQRIAICEQTEDPDQSRGIVRREVVEVISPGIILTPELLDNKSSNCIAALLCREQNRDLFVACASLDVSTGEFISSVFHGGDLLDQLLNEIEENGIREIIYPETITSLQGMGKTIDLLGRSREDVSLRPREDHLFDPADAAAVLRKHFSVPNTDAFELRDPLEVTACGSLLMFAKENVKQDLTHIGWIRGKRRDTLVIDNATKKHLELTHNQSDGSAHGTLLSVLDRTQTPMGGRGLGKLLNSPYGNILHIRKRQDQVQQLHADGSTAKKLRGALSRIIDIERILSKLSVSKANGRDLIGLSTSLKAAAEIGIVLEEADHFEEEVAGLGDHDVIVEIIDRAVVEDPPPGIREGHIIRDGYHEKLDAFRRVGRENREWINRYQHEEQRRLGIGSLKVRYNRVIGYYIEVTKPNLGLVPEHYIKKQTLVNAERFTTEELERHETLLLEAREQSDLLEFEIFNEIRERILEHTDALFGTAKVIGLIDVCCSLAGAARENNYVRPDLVEENVIDIKEGRHPVVEVYGEEAFISNDLHLNAEDRRIMILTGPNMSGKSTFLRQSALIVIMAHMGSFVPAAQATIGLVDRVFSRIGATDRLIRGESTFLVEMIETSRILHYGTERSFIIMDEIGRGTSTYDGLSIAWAVLEYLLGETVGAKVLFATHYHEITALRDRHGIVNCNVTVKEWNDTVVFLRKIVPGSASKSYGIEVARMAGIPEKVIARAKAILDNLENKYGSTMPLLLGEQSDRGDKEDGIAEEYTSLSRQYDLFPSPFDILIGELRELDIDHLTPLEALNLLDRLKKSLSL
jgi:DNA mismatch repair protein MutS